MPSPPHRAIPREFAGDDVVVVGPPGGPLRYFRAPADGGPLDPDGPDAEEFTYARPFILELEITRRCNLRCVHCYADAADRRFADELTAEEIAAVLDDGRDLGIRELSLTGGEVFCREDFFGIVDAGLARGFDVRFVTNGTLLDDARLEALCRRPIKLVTVSLDAVSAGAHERIRGAGSHAPAVGAIERLAAAGVRVSVITAFSKLNLADFDALLDFCVARGVDWQVQMTSAKGRCPREITLSPAEHYALGEKVAAAMTADLPIHVIPMDDMATFSHFGPLSALSETWQRQCTGGLLNVFVRANGDVTPCSALCFDECVVGNVRRESLRAVCREARCRDVLAWAAPEDLRGVCADCPFRLDCRGGCPEILLSMCRDRHENEYCYHRFEQARILREALGDA